MLGPLTFRELGMDDNDITLSFDRMRLIAMKMKEREGLDQSTKWIHIYSAIESKQQQEIEALSRKFLARSETVQGVTLETSLELPGSPSPEMVAQPPVIEQSKPPLELHIDYSRSLIRFHQHQLIHRVLLGWRSALASVATVEKAGSVLQRCKQKLVLLKSFATWNRRFSQHCRCLDPEKGQLLERAQEGITKISGLEAEIELQTQRNAELRTALVQQKQKEQKLKKFIRKREEERGLLETTVKSSEGKLEEEVVQLMLETRFKRETDGQRVRDLEIRLEKRERERDRLKQRIDDFRASARGEITELEGKLQSALEVTSEFRRELSILKSREESPPTRRHVSRATSPGSADARD
jgi:hypothetical protein